MSAREPELDQLTNLLGQCLGRIEEHAFRLQDETWTGDEPATGDALDGETDLLQELIGSLLVCAVDEHADLNATVQRAVQQQLGEIAVPIVVRQRFARDLPKVACTPADATFAVQRALALILGRLEPGCEISLTTRRDDGHVVFEAERRGVEFDRHLAERSETLAEFTAGLQGRCRAHHDGDTLLLALELPAALAIDER